MKKSVIILLCLALILALTACGKRAAPVAESAPTASPAPAPTAAPAEVMSTQPPEEENPASAVDEAKALVLSMKGEDIQALIDILGEPLSRDYASSCLVQGGQDGVLTYDGFTVYTLVQPDGTETVYDVE